MERLRLGARYYAKGLTVAAAAQTLPRLWRSDRDSVAARIACTLL